MLAVVRAAQQAAVDHTSVWLLVAAALVGFAAAWLVLEVSRARSPAAPPPPDESSLTRQEAEALKQLLPTLIDEIAHLRAEIAEIRAKETEDALRAHLRDRA